MTVASSFARQAMNTDSEGSDDGNPPAKPAADMQETRPMSSRMAESLGQHAATAESASAALEILQRALANATPAPLTPIVGGVRDGDAPVRRLAPVFRRDLETLTTLAEQQWRSASRLKALSVARRRRVRDLVATALPLVASDDTASADVLNALTDELRGTVAEAFIGPIQLYSGDRDTRGTENALLDLHAFLMESAGDVRD
jgi:hypothetical protein